MLTLVTGAAAIVLAQHFKLGVPQTVVSAVLPLGPAYLGWAAFRADRAEVGAAGLDAVKDRLAEAIARQRSDEVAVRRIRDPYPLPVGWQPEPELSEDWALLREIAQNWPGGPPGDSALWPATPAGLSGTGAGIGRVFNDLIPTRRLVVLGGPGSGKSVLMMQLLQELMSRRDSGGPVPVLFSLASWNPQRQHLGDWMAAEVRRAYPGLAAPAPVPATADTVSDIADHLVETNAVWPLLDGFDELPADWHAPALDAINQALPAGQPLVLASRTLDYERALDAGIVRMNGSAAVILQPLEAQAAADYLRRDAGGAHTPGPRVGTRSPPCSEPRPQLAGHWRPPSGYSSPVAYEGSGVGSSLTTWRGVFRLRHRRLSE